MSTTAESHNGNGNHNNNMIETIHHQAAPAALTTIQSNGNSSSRSETKIQKTRNDSSSSSAIWHWLLDIPLMTVFAVWMFSLLTQRVYNVYVMPMIDSYRRGALGDFYAHLENDFTYYNRLCDASDVTTNDSSDLIVRNGGKEAADLMLRHGSILFKDVLNNETTAALREYLDYVNHKQDRNELGFNEEFYSEQGRLALGLGIHDHPAISQAIEQVGKHAVVKESLEAILGPDPAVVEISTMTSMNGADDQDIHSDSDWFGSSLLYGRTFLHSYSMFIALQDTTQQMGATTVCPGSHHCANQDLEDVCLDNGAFEVSSNGHTGPDGALLKGDALLFNQNVWHRGAANKDPSLDRIMFILTYATRTKEEPSDYRQQALGTYYYQRWNMWGHTFADLKTAATTMANPFGALRGLGLWKWPSAKWGITWVEQFSRQMANQEDFYNYYCLLDFITFLNKWSVPEFLQGTLTGKPDTDNWEHFIKESMTNVTSFLFKINAAILGGYILLRLLCSAFFSKTGEDPRKLVPSWIKRLVLTHGAILLVVGLADRFIQHTELAQHVLTGHVFDKPYDYDRMEAEHGGLGPTTLPTRNDVLIGSRFDTEFLGNVNRMLNLHPGNERWLRMVEGVSQLPKDIQDLAIAHVMEAIQARDESNGLIGRFLLQDYTNGHWTLTSTDDAMRYTKKQVQMATSPLHEKLGKHLASVLAESRFGAARATAMSRIFAPLFVERWETIVFGSNDKEEAKTPQHLCRVVSLDEPVPSFFDYFQIDPVVTMIPLVDDVSPPRLAAYSGLPVPQDSYYEVGHYVLANYGEHGRWMPAQIEEILDDDYYSVQYEFGREDIHVEDMAEFISYVEGDEVDVEVGGNTNQWYEATIDNCHPDGTFSVQYGDGHVERGVKNTQMRLAGMSGPAAVPFEADVYNVNDRIQGNYKNEGEWFAGKITEVNDDDTYDILYDDGDEESNVAAFFIRKVRR